MEHAELCIRPTARIGGCHMLLTANSDYFCIHYELTALCNGDTECFRKVETNFLYIYIYICVCVCIIQINSVVQRMRLDVGRMCSEMQANDAFIAEDIF